MEKNYNLILADDDPDDRELFVDLVSQHGINVQTVSDGKRLLDYLDGIDVANTRQLIFLDLNMPVMGGKECLDHLRTNDHFHNIAVIIYSTSSNLKDIEDTFQNGAHLYLVKASSYVALKESLDKILALDWAGLTRKRDFKDFLFT